ncbi:hypothetical protein BJX96DRAFT_1791 [Aspergillus floccosus]
MAETNDTGHGSGSPSPAFDLPEIDLDFMDFDPMDDPTYAELLNTVTFPLEQQAGTLRPNAREQHPSLRTAFPTPRSIDHLPQQPMENLDLQEFYPSTDPWYFPPELPQETQVGRHLDALESAIVSSNRNQGDLQVIRERLERMVKRIDSMPQSADHVPNSLWAYPFVPPSRAPKNSIKYYRCKLCQDQRRLTKGTFMRHFFYNHRAKALYHCGFCPRRVMRRDKFVDHLRRHGQELVDKASINKYRVLEDPPEFCDICHKPVDSYKDYTECILGHCYLSPDGHQWKATKGLFCESQPSTLMSTTKAHLRAPQHNHTTRMEIRRRLYKIAPQHRQTPSTLNRNYP